MAFQTLFKPIIPHTVSTIMESPRTLLPFFFSMASSLLSLGNLPVPSEARALFVFGDSRVDNGNNNYLATPARCNFPPYGIDYPNHMPTGRYSNGLIIPDIISEHLGAEFVLPYLSPELQGEKLLLGANFASAGVGILNDSGNILPNTMKIQQQLECFEQYQQRVASLIGPGQAESLVSGGIVLITLGGNDFILNYFLTPISVRSLEFPNISDYVRFVISEYKKILRRIYDLGARRVLISGSGALGCIPGEIAQKSKNGECVPNLQQASYLFDSQLPQLSRELNGEVGADVFVAVNLFNMLMDIYSNPQAYGFISAKIACCGSGPYRASTPCLVTNVCHNRDNFVFWDGYHLSERTDRFLVSQFMSGSTDYMYPMNLSTILEMDANV